MLVIRLYCAKILLTSRSPILHRLQSPERTGAGRATEHRVFACRSTQKVLVLAKRQMPTSALARGHKSKLRLFHRTLVLHVSFILSESLLSSYRQKEIEVASGNLIKSTNDFNGLLSDGTGSPSAASGQTPFSTF